MLKAFSKSWANADRDSHERAPTPNDFKLAGVRRMEAIAAHTTSLNRVFLYAGILLCATAYGLDSILRLVYLPYITSALGNHASLGTISVATSVIGAVSQPTAARIADVFGRFELILASIVFYSTGTAIQATCKSIPIYAVGSVLYQIGYACIALLVEITVADTTTLRSRLFFSYLPAAPWLYNPWISGSIIAAIRVETFWRWGIGMWGIIFPACCLLLLVSLWWISRKAEKAGPLNDIVTPLQQHGGLRLFKALYWQLDIFGIVLIVAIFGCILVPLTISHGPNQESIALWTESKTLVPLFVGVFTIPIFVLWERSAPYPLVPFHLLKDRAVWGALGIATTFNFAFATSHNYLYSILRVSFDESHESATRVVSLYGFVSVAAGILIGLAVYRVRRLKPFIVFGTLLWLGAFGLMIHFRGGNHSSARLGIISAQVLFGIGGGFFPYAALASIQAATKHENMAVVTGLYLAVYHIGSALGNCLSAAIWTQVLPDDLKRRLGDEEGTLWYKQLVDIAQKYPFGTSERGEVVEALKRVQRLICIAGVSICLLLIFFSLVVRNPRLPDEQSMPQQADTIELIDVSAGYGLEAAGKRQRR